MRPWQHHFVSSIATIGRDVWNNLCTKNYPFMRYEFLHALEISGCTSAASGWQPHHLVITQNEEIIAVMPLYLKTDSYGEYVFDWSWADAYHRYGVNYYPKLVTAMPFTPCTGPRWGAVEHVNSLELTTYLVESVRAEAKKINASSWHFLFPDQATAKNFDTQGVSLRVGCQYHWVNRNYQNFDHFLESFVSRKRKNLKKEREKVFSQGIDIVRKKGREISEEEWINFYQFYHLTYFKRSGRQGYLNQAFFFQLADKMPESIMMVIARHHDTMIAGALFFVDDDCLYGRYWGCSQEFEFLHFEACYYQGIEYAIENSLQRFDPGAQGEHKIQRGFTSRLTYSNHWIADPRFREAIDNFLSQERPEVEQYCERAKTLLPFKV